MAEITASDIDQILREKLASLQTNVETREFGHVIQIGDGIARVDGLKSAMAGELLEFVAHDGTTVYGLAQNLEEDEVGAVLLGDYTLIKENDEVHTTGRVVEVPCGKALLGRVVNPLGIPLDGKAPSRPRDTAPSSFVLRASSSANLVHEPVQTGLIGHRRDDPHRTWPA